MQSAFQLYEIEQTYNESAGGFYFGQHLTAAMGGYWPAHAAMQRVAAANAMYGPMLGWVPGGQRRVQKIGTIAGFPAQTTMLEVWAEYSSLEGVTAVQAIALAAGDFSGPLAAYFGLGYGVGTGVSWFIQTFTPGLQRAIGNYIGWQTDFCAGCGSLTPEVILEIDQIDGLGAPGLNEVSFDGLQTDGSLWELDKIG